MSNKSSGDLQPVQKSQSLQYVGTVPGILVHAGPGVVEHVLEFFIARIENEHTRNAYGRALRQFFGWLEERFGINEGLELIRPLHIAAYRDYLTVDLGRAKSTVKQHLAAVRELFHWLVEKQHLPTNPGISVKGPKLVMLRGKTPILDDEEMMDLLKSMDVSNVVRLRDRAIIATMTYTFGRVSAAAVHLNLGDYFPQGKRWYLRLDEKNGKLGLQPVHHKLEEYLDTYLKAAGIADNLKTEPLFRSARGRSGTLTDRRMHRSDVWKMVQRRVKDAGIITPVCCHSFRAMGITNYLKNGGKREVAQEMAMHNSSQTTRLYDRRDDLVNLEEIERVRFERQG